MVYSVQAVFGPHLKGVLVSGLEQNLLNVKGHVRILMGFMSV